MLRTTNACWAGALIAFAAHNCDETIAIANGWAVRHLPRFAWTAGQWPVFAGVVTALTLIVALIAWNLRQRPDQSAKWLRVFLWVMLLNAIWHLGVSAYTRSFAPGVVTAALLILPLYSFLLHRLSRATPTS